MFESFLLIGMEDDAYEKFLEHSKTTHALGRVGTVDEVDIHSNIFYLSSCYLSYKSIFFANYMNSQKKVHRGHKFEKF